MQVSGGLSRTLPSISVTSTLHVILEESADESSRDLGLLKDIVGILVGVFGRRLFFIHRLCRDRRHLWGEEVSIVLLLLLLLLASRACSTRALLISRGLLTGIRAASARSVSTEILVRELVDQTVGAIVVAAWGAVRSGRRGRQIGGLGLVLRLVRVVHKVGGIAIARIGRLSTPNFLLAILVGKDGLRKGRWSRGILSTVVSTTCRIVSVIVEPEIELQPVRLLRRIRVHRIEIESKSRR